MTLMRLCQTHGEGAETKDVEAVVCAEANEGYCPQNARMAFCSAPTLVNPSAAAAAFRP